MRRFNLVKRSYSGSGTIQIAANAAPEYAMISVTDQGRGIAASDLPHVFERFYRADRSRSSTDAGLGRSIAKQIVEAHDGTIDVLSTEGEGSEVTVQIPVLVQ